MSRLLSVLCGFSLLVLALLCLVVLLILVVVLSCFVPLTLLNSWSDSDGRFLQCEFSFFTKLFRVCCIYGPNRNPARDLFLDGLHHRIDPLIPTVLAGDFNTVFDRGLDRFGSDPSDSSCESSSSLLNLFDSCCVLDIWWYLHPTVSGFTWTRWNGAFASRIDLFGVPSVRVTSVSLCDIVPCPFSDHCGVLLSVVVSDVIPPGPGLWKLNTSILEDGEYVRLISDLWASWGASIPHFPSLAKWWEKGKSLIKGATIRYCCDRSVVRSKNRDLLVRLAAHLMARIDAGSVSCLAPYHGVLSQLAKIDLDTARGAQVRSRIKWVEEGESSSAYFFRLEKKNAAVRWISALRESDGTIVSSPADLCCSFASFYMSLFTADVTDSSVQASLLANLPSALSSNQASQCEGHLSADECFMALQGMARRKAPGLDGLPMEFYLKFWSVLGDDLVSVLNSCLDSGCLSLSQRRGVISLSFKKGDRLDPRNWRPITLLNVDYKLAARVIAGRLLKVIHLVVDKDQTCGVPGRFIGENIALLHDVVEYATSSGTLLPSFLLIKRKRSIVSIGDLCVLLYLLWGLANLSSLGSTSFIFVYRVLLMLMVTSHLSLVCRVVLGRAVPCLHSFMCLCLKSWQPISAAIPASLVLPSWCLASVSYIPVC